MYRQCILLVIVLLIASTILHSQEAARYFPLEQGNTWLYHHQRTVEEGIVIKPARAEEVTVTTDTIAVAVNGTISALGNTYAVLEMDGEEWGSYRTEGNYIYRLHRKGGSGEYYEWRIIDLTPSDEHPYSMNPDGFYSPRTIEAVELPLDDMTGYMCIINSDPLHESESFFLVENIGPAQIGLFDAWSGPPTTDRYDLISYDIQQPPVTVESPISYSVNLIAYPNPFNPVTNITYTLAESSPVTLAVYNTSGQKVATLVDEQQAAGMHTTTFDSSGLASGLYFARMTAGGMVQTEKMVLIK